MALSFLNPGLNCQGLTCVDFPLPTGEDFGFWDIGRSKKSWVQLASKAVSRRHFRIKNNNGEWWIQDLNSENGTYVEGQKLIPGSDLRLRPFVNIFAGDVRMTWLEDCDETLPSSSCAIAQDDVETVAATIEDIAKDRPDNLWEFASAVIQVLVVGVTNPSSRGMTLALVMISLMAAIVALLWGS